MLRMRRELVIVFILIIFVFVSFAFCPQMCQLLLAEALVVVALGGKQLLEVRFAVQFTYLNISNQESGGGGNIPSREA